MIRDCGTLILLPRISRLAMKKSTNIALQIAAATLTCAAAYILRTRRASSIEPGQVVVITGGSRGLGFAIAQRFAAAGSKLVLAARNDDELHDARAKLLAANPTMHEDDILLISADLTDQEQAAGLIDHAIAAFGRVDILVNNAGIIEVGPVEVQPLDAYESAMAINYFGALYTTHAALPGMLARRAGAIVNIASIGGKVAVPHMLPYSASKFALVGFSEGLHAELRHKGIRVTTVCPGLMRTGGEEHAHFLGDVEKEQAWFKTSAKTPLLAATVEHASKVIFDAVADGRAEVTITPQAWLAARTAGLAPAFTQWAASVANEYILPDAPSGSAEEEMHAPIWASALQPNVNED